MTNSLQLSGPLSRRNDLAPAAGTIVFWANQGAMHQGLVQAMRAHLPAYEVLLVDELPEPDALGYVASLVLLDLGPGMDCGMAVASCRALFPDSALGLVMRVADPNFAATELLFERSEIQGLLPLELKLDVWLAILSLLVQGGEYYPPALSRRASQAERLPDQRIMPTPPPAATPPVDAGQAYGAMHLTPREHQVLQLLSEGYQNKLIANRMRLSEHTVKVHVHNLITKMRVTNRTQAAAAFRAGRFIAPRRDPSIFGAH